MNRSYTLEIDALQTNLGEIINFTDSALENTDISENSKMKIELCVEEIFVNIAHYAYSKQPKAQASIKVSTTISVSDDEVRISFVDRGVPFNPLAKKDPNINLTADERQIGGLGIYLVKQTMDNTFYEYSDGKNIFSMVKKIR